MNKGRFIFRNKQYSCSIYVDSATVPPFYVFIDLLDKELVDEFGKELTIKTDFETRLPRQDDYPELVELRQCIFNAIQANPEFITAKNNNTIRRSRRFSIKTARHMHLSAPLAGGEAFTCSINSLII